MKNLRRILSIIIVFSVIISSFGAFAKEYYPGYEFMDDVFKFDVGEFVSDESGVTEGEGGIDADTARIALLGTLGIWDNTEISKDELISLSDFSVIMAKLKLGTDNAFEGIYNINPSDEFATFNHAYTYLVEALGYSHKCSAYPGASDANLIVASDIGLMDARPENAGGYISRGELAKLVFKALTIDMCVMEYTQNGGYKYIVVSGKNLLNTVHGIYEITGFVNAIPGLSVYGGNSVRDGYIQVDRRNINTNGMDLAEYFGNRVKLYAALDEDTGEYSVIYIDYAGDNNVLEIDFSDIVYKDDYSLSYLSDEVELEIDIDSLTYITENGKKLNSLSEMCSYAENEGKIVFASTTKSGEFDTAMVYKYNYYVVNNVDTRLSRVAFRYGRKFEGEGYVQIDLNKPCVVYVNGTKSDYSQIPVGSAIRVFKNDVSGYIEIIASNTELISGTITAMYDDNVVISDKEYRVARDWNAFVEEKKNDTSIAYSSRPKALELGKITSVYIINGVIAGHTSTEDYTYGYIKSVTKSRTTIDPDITVRVFTQNGEWLNLTAKDKLEIDGELNVPKERIVEKINNNIEIMDHPIRFRASGSNELLALDTIEETKYELDSDEDITFNGYYKMLRDWTNENLRGSSFFVSPNVALFIIPNGSTSEEDFKITTYPALSTGSNGIAVKLYNINEYRQLELCVVTTDPGSGGSSGGGITPFYVQSMRKAVIDADNQIYGYKLVGKQCKGISRGVGNVIDASYYITEDMLDVNEEDEAFSEDNVIEVGDFLSIQISGTEIISWSMLCKDGQLPSYAADGESNIESRGSDAYFGRGTFVRADPVQGIYVVKVDGVEYPCIPTCPVIIDSSTQKMVKATTTDFEEGDEVYYYANYGRSPFLVKCE